MLGSLLKSLAGRRRGPPAPAAKPRFVAFTIPSDTLHRFSPDDKLSSSQASTRLRVQVPGREVSRTIATYAVPLGAMLNGALEPLGEPLAVVIGHISAERLAAREADARALLDWTARNASRLRIFADLSESYAGMAAALQAPFLEEYQRRLGAHCTFIVPCEALRQCVEADAANGVRVIEDPWESPRINAPRMPRPDSPRLAWFGNLDKTAMPVVEQSFASLALRFRHLPLQLELLAQDARRELAAAMLERIARQAPAWSLQFTPWSAAATWAAIDAADIVLLPQDASGGWRSAKSHNRLVEAIRGGRLALASPIPAYQELAEGAWVGENLADGLAWALDAPAQALQRIAVGQARIAGRFSPSAVGAKWRDVLGTP